MEITGNTRIMGMVGDPIAQITTPNAINPIFEHRGNDVICVPFHIAQGRLRAAWPGFRENRSLVGLGITIPHKKEAAELCDKLGPSAKRMGVVNAIRRENDGSMTGEMFDGVGFIGGLSGQGHSVGGKTVLMIGAGGAAKAVAFALFDADAKSVTIINRTREKGEDLARTINRLCGREFVFTTVAPMGNYEIIVNCSSLGLSEDDPLPLEPALFKRHQLVAEIVAKPLETRFLAAARLAGCVTHAGIHMINHQVRTIADFISSSSN